MMPKVEMNDGGIVGKLQVKLMVPFHPFIFVFFSKLKNCFQLFFLGNEKNNNNDAWSVM